MQQRSGAIVSEKAEDVVDLSLDTFRKLDAGKIDVNDARARCGVLRTANAYISLELEHAKLTGRLEPGSCELAGFERVAPKSVSSEEAMKRMPSRGVAKAG